MPIVNKIQNSFTSGELDPKLRARNDIAVFYSGANKLRNVLPIPQGAVKRRPGLEYIDTIDSPVVKFYEFTYTGTTTYLMVLVPGTLYIYKDGALMDTVSIAAVTADRLPNVTFTHSNDTMLLFHEEFSPIYVLRASDTSWSTGTWTILNTPSYRFDTTATSVTMSVTDTAGNNIDFSNVWVDGNTYDGKVTAGGNVFTATDAGRYIRSINGGLLKITSYTDATHCNVTILKPFMEEISTGATLLAAGEWYFEDEVFSSTYGYPRCGAFYQGRLWLASTPYLPNGIWASKTNDEEDFANWVPDFADYGLFLVAKDARTPFHTAHVGRHLTFFSTQAGMFIDTPNNEPATPTNVSIRPMASNIGAADGVGIYEVAGATIFLQNGGKSVIENQYSFAQGSYSSANLNLLASHVLNSPIAMGYRKQTNTDEADYILICNSDGKLAVLNTLRDQEINAWTICETEGNFMNVSGVGSDIYFAVQRDINGSKVTFLEKFNDDLLVDAAVINPGTQLTYDGVDMTYDGVDMTYTSDNKTTISGLSHLYNEEVQVVVDNLVDAAQTVPISGTLTLGITGTDVQAGLNFPVVDTDTSSRVFIESMPVELDLGGGGSTVGKKKRVSNVTLMLYETSHCTVMSNNVPIRRIGIDHLDSSIPKRTEDLKINGILGWNEEIKISVAQTLPLPLTLLGMAYQVRA